MAVFSKSRVHKVGGAINHSTNPTVIIKTACYWTSVGFYWKILLLTLINATYFQNYYWSLTNSTKAKGTLLGLHGPPNGPRNGPWEANFRAPLVKKGPARSDHGPNWSIFLDSSQDNGHTWIYSLVWGQSDIQFRRYNYFDSWWANWPPPHPRRLRVKRLKMPSWSPQWAEWD